MFGEISFAICGIDISAQRSLSPNKREEAVVVVSICIPAQPVASVDWVATGFGYFRSGDELATLEFRRYFPQLTLFPSGCIICACVCTAYLNTERCKMTYAELLDKHAGENEIRSFLVDGDTVPVTLRIPANLRDSAKEAAALRGMSFSAFMRACMIDELAKGGRK